MVNGYGNGMVATVMVWAAGLANVERKYVGGGNGSNGGGKGSRLVSEVTNVF